MNSIALGRVIVFGVAVSLALGCGGGAKPPPMVPVTGKVTVEGAPVRAGHVTLFPVAKDAFGALSAGEIDDAGTYEIVTANLDGAPLGKYKVTVNPPMMPSTTGKMPERPYDPIFSDMTKTTLSIEVVSNPATGAYDLKLTKEPDKKDKKK